MGREGYGEGGIWEGSDMGREGTWRGKGNGEGGIWGGRDMGREGKWGGKGGIWGGPMDMGMEERDMGGRGHEGGDWCTSQDL